MGWGANNSEDRHPTCASSNGRAIVSIRQDSDELPGLALRVMPPQPLSPRCCVSGIFANIAEFRHFVASKRRQHSPVGRGCELRLSEFRYPPPHPLVQRLTVNRRSATTRAPWFAYLWPGLPHLWVDGSWAGLALAIAFAALLNLGILGTFVWPELFPPRARLVGAGVLALLWTAALWETRGELRRQAARRDPENPTPDEMAQDQQTKEIARLFCEAQTSYLAGDWAATEQLLLDILRIDRDDIECQLMLATLWRRMGRSTDALRRLRRISRLDAALPWQFEIHREIEFAENHEMWSTMTNNPQDEAA